MVYTVPRCDVTMFRTTRRAHEPANDQLEDLTCWMMLRSGAN